MNHNHHLARILLPAAVVVMTLVPALASAPAPANPAGAPVSPVANPCARPPAGSIVQNPPALFSHGGTLTARFSYQTRTDADGRTLFCFMTPDGLENPTLYVFPGDQIVLTVTNNTPAAPVEMKINPPNCGASMMTESSVNLHYHGTNTSPTCHQDEVIQTVINSGQTFTYDLHIPPDEPPGLYWYHPHIHGLVEHALQGGGSGAIVVEGIQDIQPAVAGMRQQVLVVRDQNVRGNPMPGGNVPSWDVTVNNIPIAYPDEIPAILQMRPGEQQFWRVSNSSADTVLDLQVLFDGEPQTVQIVDFDGVPAGSQDGTNTGKLVAARDVLIPTAGRAEFIVKAPPATVRDARLVTLTINTGPDGDNDPERTLATIETSSEGLVTAAGDDRTVAPAVGPTWKQRFEKLASAKVTAERTLYFSENNPLSQFFITVEGAAPTLFDPNNPPAIVTTQGSVEDWTIENRTLEVHEFHIHQTHFLVLSQNNFAKNGSQPDPSIQHQFLDTIQVPFWDGNPKHPYPNVKVRIDFRGHDIGDFVYHCHIAEHEDGGMMAIIRVVPASGPGQLSSTRDGLTGKSTRDSFGKLGVLSTGPRLPTCGLGRAKS